MTPCPNCLKDYLSNSVDEEYDLICLNCDMKFLVCTHLAWGGLDSWNYLMEYKQTPDALLPENNPEQKR